MRRYGLPRVEEFNFTMVSWAQDPENAKAWKEIMLRHKLSYNPFNDPKANFEFGDMILVRDACLCMNKASRGSDSNLLRMLMFY